MPDSAQSRHPGAAQLAAFAQGKLAAAERAALQAHLKACPGCRQALAALPAGAESVSGRDTLATMGARPSRAATHLPGSDVPAGLADHPRYEVLEMLGQGGMGAVYKARHKKMDRLVALKVISARVLDNPKAVERFQREVKAAAKLEHPNIVRAYDADEAGGTHFLVMEFVEGTDLAQYVEEKGPLPVARACQFIRQAALGLEHAHQHGMVHRDVKPHNLMLANPVASAPGVFTVKVMDFGLARLARETASEAGLTCENALMGTADYIAPEQAADAHTADIRADIYSLGCSLFHLLAGQPMLEGASVTQKLAAHLMGKLPLGDLPASVPAKLRAVLSKMVAKDPAQRYQTPDEVAAALVPFLKKATEVQPPPLPAPASPAEGSRDRTTMLKPRAAKATTVATARSRPAAKPSWKLWLVTGAGVAVMGMLGLCGLEFGVGFLRGWRQPNKYAEEQRRASPENLYKLQVGMTRKEVEDILSRGQQAHESDADFFIVNSLRARSTQQNAWKKAIKEGRVQIWHLSDNHRDILATFPDNNPSGDSKVDVLLTGDYRSSVQTPPVQNPPDKWVVNKDNFLKIQVGMTLRELEDIIGVGEPARFLRGNEYKGDSDAWPTAVNQYRVYRWGGDPVDATKPVILAVFSEPPSAAPAAKAEALNYRDGVWDQDKGTLSAAKG